MSFLNRLRGIPPSPEEVDRRKREREQHETRMSEVRSQERQARYEGYRRGRVESARRHGYEKGVSSSRTVGERVSGFGQVMSSMSRGFGRELDELGSFGRPARRPMQRRSPSRRSSSRRRAPQRREKSFFERIME